MAVDFSFINRVPLHPGRVTLNPVAGESGKYDMERSDEPLEKGTPLNADTFNNLVTLINADIESAKNEAISAGLKCVTGTYTGTGTYGSSNKTTLNFGFKPLFVYVANSSQGTSESASTSSFKMKWAGMIACTGQTATYVASSWEAWESGAEFSTNRLSWTETGVSWYGDNQGYQLNQKSTTYRYFAIG